jgi:hypothetical protein
MTPTPATVLATPAAAATPVTPAAPAGPTAAELATLTAERDALKATAAEQQRAAEYWHEKATKGAAPAPKKEEPEPEVDLLDLITSGGPKALKAYLRKEGLVTGADVEATVSAKVAQVTAERQLLDDYPDLGKKDSEFFQATAGIYGELKKAGVPETLAMQLAAQRAELEGLKSGKIKTPQQVTDDAKAARTAERAARAAAGAGDRGHQATAEEDDDTPTPDEQRAIARLADALEISVEKATERYKARAKKGVNVALKIGGK